MYGVMRRVDSPPMVWRQPAPDFQKWEQSQGWWGSRLFSRPRMRHCHYRKCPLLFNFKISKVPKVTRIAGVLVPASELSLLLLSQ